MRAKLAWVLSATALMAVVTGTPATAEERTVPGVPRSFGTTPGTSSS